MWGVPRDEILNVSRHSGGNQMRLSTNPILEDLDPDIPYPARLGNYSTGVFMPDEDDLPIMMSDVGEVNPYETYEEITARVLEKERVRQQEMQGVRQQEMQASGAYGGREGYRGGVRGRGGRGMWRGGRGSWWRGRGGGGGLGLEGHAFPTGRDADRVGYVGGGGREESSHGGERGGEADEREREREREIY